MTLKKFLEMEELYQSGKTYSLQWRLTQLQILRELLTDNTDELLNALKVDLNKSSSEGIITEINIIITEIDFISQNLESWITPKQVPSPALMTPCFSEIRYEPKGVCLIIGSCNYPINLTLLPTVGSLASGNPTVVKPSELCKETSKVLFKLVHKYFDTAVLQVVEGEIPETTMLLKKTWGTILFTGSERVGKIVAMEAAKTLSPVILELGGKSPTYIDIDCPNDMRTVAMRIVWGKLLNAGQTCLAPDYVLVHEKHYNEFCKEVVLAIERMFTKDPATCSDLPRMATIKHAERQLSLIKDVESKIQSSSLPSEILWGGSKFCNITQKYIAPTVVLNPPLDCTIMKEEIFGPILPIIPISNLKDALTFIRNYNKNYNMTPLAAYIFTTNNQTYETFIKQVKSGGILRNDVILHCANRNVPFGGSGSSGYGSYHGKYSLDAFSHKRAVLYKPALRIFEFGDLRYHPYSKFSLSTIDLFSRCPDIPNLHSRKLIIFGTMISVATFGMNMYGIDVKNIAANSLRTIADYLDP